MTRGKTMLLIVAGFVLIWITLTVFAVRHVITVSDLAQREVSPALPAIREHVAEDTVSADRPYPADRIAETLPQLWNVSTSVRSYPKVVLAESPDKGQDNTTDPRGRR